MTWLPSIFAALPVIFMAWVALGPTQSKPAHRVVLALVCACIGSLLLAGQAPSLLGLLPCDLQPFSPPCEQMRVEANAGTYVALAGLLFLAIGGLSLYLPQAPSNGAGRGHLVD